MPVVARPWMGGTDGGLQAAGAPCPVCGSATRHIWTRYGSTKSSVERRTRIGCRVLVINGQRVAETCGHVAEHRRFKIGVTHRYSGADPTAISLSAWLDPRDRHVTEFGVRSEERRVGKECRSR